MSEVKRYDQSEDSYGNSRGMKWSPYGDYVLASDYDQLKAENERLRNSLSEVATRIAHDQRTRKATDSTLDGYLAAGISAADAERDTLRTQLAQQERHYPLPDDLYPGSKDWLAADYAGRVEWLHGMYESSRRVVDELSAPQQQKPYSEAGLNDWANGKFTVDGKFIGCLQGNTDWAIARVVWSAALASVHPAPADAALVEALEEIAAERMMCDSASDAKTKVVSLGLCINRIQTTANEALAAARGK